MGAEVDLSNGKYDEFETLLSKELGIKVILVRGWEGPEGYGHAHSACYGCRTQEELDEAQKKFRAIEEITLGSLQAYLADRDPEIGNALTPNELRSLLNVQHVTKRESNADQEQAVIIFDPRERSGRWGRNPVLETLLTGGFSNEWNTHRFLQPATQADAAEAYRSEFIDTGDVIENFDIAEEDLRRYQAIKEAFYALRNQNEYSIPGDFNRDQPSFYALAGLERKDSTRIWQSPSNIPYEEVVRSLMLDRLCMPGRFRIKPERFGIKDPDFFAKLRLASAVKDLINSFLSLPNETFGRLDCSGSVTPMQVYEIQKDLKGRLEKQLEKRLPKDYHLSFISRDLRILFPVFREIYEKDRSKGPEREYLNTVMEGLQKWFPTITNAPVPKLEGTEPPRKVEEPSVQAAASPRRRLRWSSIKNRL